MWNLAGLTLCLAVSAIAFVRSRAQGGFYDAEVYAMTPAAHRRYAWVSLAFGLFFAIAWLRDFSTAGVYALAVYALIVIVYATSFLRGAHEDEGDGS
ncbi:MAG TPA: hypothetical protein VMF61_16615 [Candidatus Acidoferrales bacterium]|nr:hypothetical protein [Candidatus Acidoferrales bacterium]